MSISYVPGKRHYVGLSTDNKDANVYDNGATLFIADTGAWFIYCDGDWYSYFMSVKTLAE